MISWAAGACTSTASMDLPPEGSVTTLGGFSATTTAVGAEVCVSLPGVFFAVTERRRVLPLSAATSTYVLLVAPVIGVHAAPVASQRDQAYVNVIGAAPAQVPSVPTSV